MECKILSIKIIIKKRKKLRSIVKHKNKLFDKLNFFFLNLILELWEEKNKFGDCKIEWVEFSHIRAFEIFILSLNSTKCDFYFSVFYTRVFMLKEKIPLQYSAEELKHLTATSRDGLSNLWRTTVIPCDGHGHGDGHAHDNEHYSSYTLLVRSLYVQKKMYTCTQQIAFNFMEKKITTQTQSSGTFMRNILWKKVLKNFLHDICKSFLQRKKILVF